MSTNPTSLDNLHDIVMPDPISWWPLAPGWYVVILGLLIAAIWASIRFIQQWQKNRFRREALHELESIKPSELPSLVKRVALCAWPREQVASLSGDDWLQFLQRNNFPKNLGKNLITLSYSPSSNLKTNSPEFSELKTTVRTWIQKIPNS